MYNAKMNMLRLNMLCGEYVKTRIITNKKNELSICHNEINDENK